MSGLDVRREVDSAPCEVVVAQFVFGVDRCRADAPYTVASEGARWRVCADHLQSRWSE